MYTQQRIPPLAVRLFAGSSLALILLIGGGCRTLDGASNSVVSALSPYKMEVVQGNFVSREQAELIQPGMSRNQVRAILGTPLLIDIFHPQRWDYVFSIKRKGIEPLERRFTVFFDNEVVARVEASGELLSEQEFVLHLDAQKPNETIKVPVLQATPEQLERAAASAQAYRERVAQRQSAEQQNTATPSSYYPPVNTN